jgi:CelD/BcsL family acetyltransferase involved in cellulose biosynthesis
MTDYLEPLCADSNAWPAFTAFLAANWDRRLNEVVFHNIRESSSLRRDLPKSEFSINEEVIDHAPAIDLPSTWEKFLDSLDAHDRKETRRKLNKAEEKGDAKLVAGSAKDLDDAVKLVEAAGGRKGDTARRFLHPLLTSAGPSLIADGRLQLLKLLIQGKFTACLLQFPTQIGPMLYNAGHEPSMREWSPGVVAVAMAIRQAIERGEKTYDLMRGREPYKYRFGAVDRPLYRITLRKK